MTGRDTTSHRTRPEQVLIWLASVAVGMLCVGILLLSATIWWPYHYVSRLDITVRGTPHVGGVLVAKVDYCKPVEVSPRWVRWTLINDVTIVIDDDAAGLPAGCHVTDLVFALPGVLPAGSYRLQVEGVYEPWPWRRVPYLARSQAFVIEP